MTDINGVPVNTEVDNIVDENGLLDISSQQVGQSTGSWEATSIRSKRSVIKRRITTTLRNLDAVPSRGGDRRGNYPGARAQEGPAK